MPDPVAEIVNFYRVYHSMRYVRGDLVLRLNRTISDATLQGKKDAKQVNEITWTPNADGSVRQHWRISADGGKTWTTSFDGKYVRVKR